MWDFCRARDWNRTSTPVKAADLPAGRQVLSLLRLPIPVCHHLYFF